MNEAVLNRPQARRTVMPVLGAASFCHFLNDMIQSLFVAAYPVFKGGFDLSFAQLGLLTLTYQVTASLLQPFIGHFTDRRPQPYSLPFGMGMSLAGLLVLSSAPSFAVLLIGSAMLGVGSSIFHPESSRLARLASGGAHGFAQSLFQVGGNVGSAVGPLLVVAVVLPHGQGSLAWFAFAALGGVVILTLLGRWYKRNGHAVAGPRVSHVTGSAPNRRQIVGGLSVLFCLMLSKWFYLASFTSYYVFYLLEKFPLTEGQAQIYLFVFLASVAAGTLIGGSVGDRVGRKKVIWGSILGALPFAMVLPYVGLTATVILSIFIGIILSSAFSAIVVYAQELVPGRIGMISGLFFGLAFGLGGIGAAILGVMADTVGLEQVYRICAFLPAIGFLAVFLPDIEQRQ